MRRGGEVARANSRELLSDAISRIFPERASFELREDDVEALRQQLRNGHLSKGLESLGSQLHQKEVEEAAQWKVALNYRFLDEEKLHDSKWT